MKSIYYIISFNYFILLLLGKLHPDDVAARIKAELENPVSDNDPYKNDPIISPILKSYQKRPLNAEAPESLLTQSWITPTDLWFKRNHHPIPNINPKEYVLTIKIPTLLTTSTLSNELPPQDATIHSYLNKNIQQKEYTIQDLQTKFKPYTVVASLQCGGNRRMGMNDEGVKIGNNATLGIAWSGSAISTAEFTGARLIDILLDSGLDLNSIELIMDEISRDIVTSTSSTTTTTTTTNNNANNNNKEKTVESVDEEQSKQLLLIKSLKSQYISQLHSQFLGYDDMEASVPLQKVRVRVKT